jgi:hypothetical protein
LCQFGNLIIEHAMIFLIICIEPWPSQNRFWKWLPSYMCQGFKMAFRISYGHYEFMLNLPFRLTNIPRVKTHYTKLFYVSHL